MAKVLILPITTLQIFKGGGDMSTYSRGKRTNWAGPISKKQYYAMEAERMKARMSPEIREKTEREAIAFREYARKRAIINREREEDMARRAEIEALEMERKKNLDALDKWGYGL